MSSFKGNVYWKGEYNKEHMEYLATKAGQLIPKEDGDGD